MLAKRQDDDLNAARGVFNGFILSAIFWASVAVVIVSF